MISLFYCHENSYDGKTGSHLYDIFRQRLDVIFKSVTHFTKSGRDEGNMTERRDSDRYRSDASGDSSNGTYVVEADVSYVIKSALHNYYLTMLRYVKYYVTNEY